MHTDWPISLCSNNLTIVTVPLRKGRFHFVAAKKKHTAETSLQLQRQYRKAVLQRQDQLCSEITFPAATPENCFCSEREKNQLWSDNFTLNFEICNTGRQFCKDKVPFDFAATKLNKFAAAEATCKRQTIIIVSMPSFFAATSVAAKTKIYPGTEKSVVQSKRTGFPWIYYILFDATTHSVGRYGPGILSHVD